MTRRIYAKIVLGAIATIAVGISACVLYSYYVRWEAERCLRIFSQFRTGSTTIEEATKALAPFSRYEVDGTSREFGSDYSLHTYQINNSGNHLLGIFKPTYFQIGLTYRPDGVVIEMSASLSQMPYRSVVTIESIIRSEHIQALHDSTSGVIVNVFDPPLKMNVSLNPRASDADRKAAFDFNLGCFTSVFGCRSVYKILPGVEHHEAR